MARDQSARIVDEDLGRHAAERGERAFQAFKPTGLAFIAEGAHVAQPRMTQGRDKHEGLYLKPRDVDKTLAKINL